MRIGSGEIERERQTWGGLEEWLAGHGDGGCVYNYPFGRWVVYRYELDYLKRCFGDTVEIEPVGMVVLFRLEKAVAPQCKCSRWCQLGAQRLKLQY